VAVWIRAALGAAGLLLQILVLDAAIRTFLLPRAASVRLSRLISRTVGWLFWRLAGARRTFDARDRILSLYPSMVLLVYQALWLGLSLTAFAFGFVAAGAPSFARGFETSGSSLLTLGTTSGSGPAQATLTYSEAALGLGLMAMLIAFIPALYSAFQRREISVSRLSVRAGIPATPWGVLEIAQSVASWDRLEELWREWEQWFIELGETHTTLTILNYYRSPTPDQTWIGAAASVLDAAALFNAAVDVPASPMAGLCIRSGWLNLRRLADYFGIAYPTKVDRSVPITITRAQFDTVLGHLERNGIPLLADRDAAWRDFVGWRANYDAILEACYDLFTCPRISWDSARDLPLVEPSNVRAQ
jgi:hypothetical protein